MCPSCLQEETGVMKSESSYVSRELLENTLNRRGDQITDVTLQQAIIDHTHLGVSNLVS